MIPPHVNDEELEKYQYYIGRILNFIKEEKLTNRQVTKLAAIFTANIEFESDSNRNEFMEKEYKFNDYFQHRYKMDKKK